MSRMFTVELERIDVRRATLTVRADTLDEATREAIGEVRRADSYWDVDQGAVLIKKVTAHAAKESK